MAKRCNLELLCSDAWLSLVERCVRDAEVAGSNPVASIPWQGRRETLITVGFPGLFLWIYIIGTESCVVNGIVVKFG